MLGFALSLLCLRLVSVVDHGGFLFVPFWLVTFQRKIAGISH
jgi:hypothetical protein